MELCRKYSAHPPVCERFNEPIIVFLTVCSKGRKPILAQADSVAVTLGAWQQAKTWTVGRYVVLPDHIHLFCAPAVFPTEPLMQWVRYWKSIASKKRPRPNEHPIWQRDFWDTQLRRSENYDSKWQYVVDNPVRVGLMPFQGELNFLPW
jgi:REP element-mobilizing transposase RayT